MCRYYLLLISQEDRQMKEIKVSMASSSTLKKQWFSHTLASMVINISSERSSKGYAQTGWEIVRL